MSVSLAEHRLGGLRWIVLTGPDREAFGALGEHVRAELAALAEAWPVLPRLAPSRGPARRAVTWSGRGPPGTPTTAATFSGAEPEADGTSAARGETLDALGVPAEDPGPVLVPGRPHQPAARRRPLRPRAGRPRADHAVHARRRPDRGGGRDRTARRAARRDPAGRPGRGQPAAPSPILKQPTAAGIANVGSMKALVYHGPGQKAWEDVPDAAIREPTDVVVKVDTTTICGTDLHILHGDVPAVTDGRILGHEAVGTVTEVGDAVKGFSVGDRVLVPAITKCGRCEYCQRSMPSHCQTVGGIGWIFGHLIDGTQAESVRVPYADTSLYAVPGQRHQRAGHLPRRLAADRLRGRRARREGPPGRHRRGGRRRRGGPVRHPDHRPVGRLPGHRGRHEQVPAGQGAGLRRHRHRGSRRQHHRRRPGPDRRRSASTCRSRRSATPRPC